MSEFVGEFSIGVRVGLGTDGRDLERVGALADLAADGGADGLYLAGTPARGGEELDPLVVLGSLVGRSAPLRLGELASPVDRRPPSLLAKLVSSLDVLSGGRALVVLGEPATGDGGAVLTVLHESLEVVRAMLRTTAPRLVAPHLSIDGAYNEPSRAGADPVPLGLLVERRAWRPPPGGAEPFERDLLMLAARFCEYCFVGLAPDLDPVAIQQEFVSCLVRAGRLPGDARLVALVGAEDPARARERRDALVALGYAGIVLDLDLDPDPGELGALLEALRS